MPVDDFYSIVEDALPDRSWSTASFDEKRIAVLWAPHLHVQPNVTLAAQALLCVASFIETESLIRELTALEAETVAMLLPTVHDWIAQGHIHVEPAPPRTLPVPGDPLPLFGGWKDRIEVQPTPRDVLKVAGITAKNMIDDHTIIVIRPHSPLALELKQLASHLLHAK